MSETDKIIKDLGLAVESIKKTVFGLGLVCDCDLQILNDGSIIHEFSCSFVNSPFFTALNCENG